MDQELIAHLDAKLEGFASHIDRRFEETQEQIRENRTLILETRDEVRENRVEIGKNRMEIGKNRTRIDDTQALVEGQRSELQRLDEKIDRRFDETQEQNRHTHVVIEGQLSKVKLLAEGHAAQDEKIDRRFDQAESGRQSVRDHLEGMIKGLFVSLSRRDDEIEQQIEQLEAAG